MARKALAAALLLANAGMGFADEQEPLPPISLLTAEEFPARCAAFRLAIRIYAQILGSNPVYGRDSDREGPFRWVDTLIIPDTAPQQDLVGHYITAFCPITAPTLVPNLPVYQADKTACMAAFGPTPDN